MTEYMLYLGGIKPTLCEDGAVRLAGKLPNRGRVEICRGNVWGSVCYSIYLIRDARVMCRTLGFSNVGEILWSDYLQ